MTAKPVAPPSVPGVPASVPTARPVAAQPVKATAVATPRSGLVQTKSLSPVPVSVPAPVRRQQDIARQFEAAEELGARIALLYGDEWPQVKVKDMTTGEQTLISKNDVISRMEPLLP